MSKSDKVSKSNPNDAKKGGKGIPRVTAAVVAMDEAGRKAWLASLYVCDEVRKIVESNLAKALKKGVKGSRKFNVEATLAVLAKQPVETLVEIQKGIAPLIAAGKDEAAARIKEQIAALEAQAAVLDLVEA